MRLSLLAAPLFVVLACGGSDTVEGDDFERHGVPSSCDLTAASGYCLDFDAQGPKDVAAINCAGARDERGEFGTAADVPCPAENRVGSCASERDGFVVTHRYYAPHYTFGSARQHCGRVNQGASTFTED